MINKLIKALYVLLGVLYVLIGTGALVIPAGWIPLSWIGDIYGGEIPGPNAQHLMQEFGTVVIAVGMMFLWRASRADYSAGFHWAMTAYLALDMLIHWVGPQGLIGSLQRGLINSIPFTLMLILGLLHPRQRAQGEVMQ